MPVNSFDNYPMSWKPKKDNLKPPIYKSLALLLENDIRSGSLNPGDKLPPQRELADFMDLNLSTITRAFKICEMKGLITGSMGKGTYISGDVKEAPLILSTLNDDYVEMGAALPFNEQNKYVVDTIKRTLKKGNIEKLLQYGPPCGLLSHRKTACKYLKRYHIKTTPDNVMIASGSQNALSIILMSLFNAGDRIGTDPLTYPAFKTLAKMLGICLVPLPLNEPDIDEDALSLLIQNENVKGLYIIPEMHNPTAYNMEYSQKKKLASVIKKNNIILIEDAVYAYTNKKSMPISTTIPDNSIYVSSLSKAICPGLRVSFLVVPDKFKNNIFEGIYNVNIATSSLNAEIACEAIETGISEKIIKDRLNLTRKRNEIVDKILKHRTVLGNDYALYRWLVLPKSINSSAFEAEALKRGVQIFCAQRFVVGNSKFDPAARLSVCSPRSCSDLEHALKIIDKLIDDLIK